MEVFDAQRLKALEDENSKPRRLVADAVLDNAVFHDPFPAFRLRRALAATRGCYLGAARVVSTNRIREKGDGRIE